MPLSAPLLPLSLVCARSSLPLARRWRRRSFTFAPGKWHKINILQSASWEIEAKWLATGKLATSGASIAASPPPPLGVGSFAAPLWHYRESRSRSPSSSYNPLLRRVPHARPRAVFNKLMCSLPIRLTHSANQSLAGKAPPSVRAHLISLDKTSCCSYRSK